MAAPHVTGLVTTLMQPDADFQWRPHLTRAFALATSLLHNDDPFPDDNTDGGTRSDYGLGRVSAFVFHWSLFDSTGWSTHWAWGPVTSSQYIERDIAVPVGTRRLVVRSS
jgi:hypothetical protein